MEDDAEEESPGKRQKEGEANNALYVRLLLITGQPEKPKGRCPRGCTRLTGADVVFQCPTSHVTTELGCLHKISTLAPPPPTHHFPLLSRRHWTPIRLLRLNEPYISCHWHIHAEKDRQYSSCSSFHGFLDTSSGTSWPIPTMSSWDITPSCLLRAPESMFYASQPVR
jgi:hypothetical protein